MKNSFPEKRFHMLCSIFRSVGVRGGEGVGGKWLGKSYRLNLHPRFKFANHYHIISNSSLF